MTERQRVFYEIAEAFGTPREKRNRRQRDLTVDGIYFALAQAAGWLSPKWSVADNRLNAATETRDYHEDTYLCETNDDIRCLFALLLAELTDEELGI